MIAPLVAEARHILIIFHDFSTGGSERIAIRLANRWAASGRRVTILCGTAEGAARALVDPGIRIAVVRPEIPRGPFSRLRLGRAMARRIDALAPDLLFVPGNFHLPVVWAIGRPALAGIPVVAKLSNPLARADRGRAGTTVFGAALRQVTRGIDSFVAMSDALADEARAILPNARIATICEPNLGDVPAGAAPAGGTAPPLILCAGRLVAQKNFRLALRAFARLAARRPARLLILGEGDQRAMLEQEVERLGLADRVEFGGHVADIRPALAEARLLLLSSTFEGYPAVVVEALAAGRPVVATRCSPSIGEMIAHPSFGRVVDPDPDRLAHAMAATIDAGYPDPDALAPLLARHQIADSAAAYLALFDGVVAARATDRVRPR